MSQCLHWSIIVAACLAFARPSLSAPPDFAQVPADAAWIVHVDFDALHKSTVCQKLSAAALARWKPLAGQLAKVHAQLGMDLSKDLHGMTIFGPKLSENKGTLVMGADWQPQTFRQKLALAPNHETSTSGQYEIHRFTRNDQGQLRPVAGACWQRGTFVFGQTVEDVCSGLDVLDGRRPHLDSHSSMLAADVPPGTLLLTRVILVDASPPVESPLLKQAERIDLSCGEIAGECFLRGSLLEKDARTAEQAKKMVEGVLAMVRFHAAEDPGAAKLLDRVEVRVEDRAVRLDFRIPADELAAVLQRAMENQ